MRWSVPRSAGTTTPMGSVDPTMDSTIFSTSTIHTTRNGWLEAWRKNFAAFHFREAMHWGHAISRDLVNWVHQPIILRPTDKICGNECGWFSGSAIPYGDEGLRIFVTDHNSSWPTLPAFLSLPLSFVSSSPSPGIPEQRDHCGRRPAPAGGAIRCDRRSAGEPEGRPESDARLP